MGEGEVCVAVLSKGELENERNSRGELKRDLHCVITDSQEDSPCKKQAKETINDDVCFEVTDTIISPRENHNTSNMHANNGSISQAVNSDNNGSNQHNSGDITSTSEEMSSDEDSSGLSTSHVILEIPKHTCTTGIRKITFKFSNSKEDYTSSLSKGEAPQLLSHGVHRGDLPLESREGDSRSHVSRNMELKMSKKVLPNSCLTYVKKLLSTGIWKELE